MADRAATTYGPSSGARFLTRDPLEAVTRSAYGYADNNPINFIDPNGLNKCEVGANPLRWGGNAQACADDAIDKAAEEVSHTARVLHRRLGADGIICLGYCVGLEYNHGHLYLNVSLRPDWIVGASASVNVYGQPLDQWSVDGGACGDDGLDRYTTWGLTAFGASNNAAGDASAGYGPGFLLGRSQHMQAIEIF